MQRWVPTEWPEKLPMITSHQVLVHGSARWARIQSAWSAEELQPVRRDGRMGATKTSLFWTLAKRQNSNPWFEHVFFFCNLAMVTKRSRTMLNIFSVLIWSSFVWNPPAGNKSKPISARLPGSSRIWASRRTNNRWTWLFLCPRQS